MRFPNVKMALYGFGVFLWVSACSVAAQAQRWATSRSLLPPAIDWPSGGAAGDVDRDGDLDLYLAQVSRGLPSFYSAQDRLLLNDGRGGFTDATSRLPVDSDESHGVALGDIDNDGDLDVVIANEASRCRVYLNDGLGNFQDAPALLPSQPSFGPSFFCVALSDLDLDGDLDVFFAGESNRLWLNQGLSGFADVTATHLPPPRPSPVWTRDVAVGDVDGDGDADLVLGNLGAQQGGAPSELYLNTGGARFVDVTTAQLGSASRPTVGVDLGDIDGDGDLDIYIANSRNGALPAPLVQDQIYLNVGSGRFVETLLALPGENYSTNDAIFVDLDRDGDLDLLTANGNPSGFSGLPEPDEVLINDGNGIFTVQPRGLSGFAVEWSTHRWVTGDFDGDGDMDGIAIAAVETRLFLNRGNAELVDVTSRYPWWIDAAPAVGDFDRDGIVDMATLAMRGSELPRCMLLRGLGNGEFIDVSTRMANDVPEASVVSSGDIDLDGDIDLVFGTESRPSNRIVIARNDGAGSFTTALTLTFPEPIAQQLLGDLDGDGLLDIAVGTTRATAQSVPSTRIFLNRGSTGFSELAGAVPLDPGDTMGLALGDLDGDGDLDLFLAKDLLGTAGGIENRVYANLGNGRYVGMPGALPSHVEPSSSISLGDVDGDGDLDALVGNGTTGSNNAQIRVVNRLYLNNGNGTFIDGTARLPSLPPDRTRAVALFDADADGDLDAYIGNGRDAQRFYRNDGTGRFIDASMELPAWRALGGGVAIADIDRDGDFDILSGNLGGLVQFNLHRHLARRTPQSLGKTFAMDLNGDPNAPWILLASPGTASIGIPPFGTLFLDPVNLGIVATGSFDAQGRASLDFRVPRWRALLGQSVYWQTVMNVPPRFSSLEITTVTDY